MSVDIENHHHPLPNSPRRQTNWPCLAYDDPFWGTLTDTISPVTRSHKYTDRDHAGLADGTASPQEHLPRYFAKHGHEGVDPKKVKKNGGGRSNWYDWTSLFALRTPLTHDPSWPSNNAPVSPGTQAEHVHLQLDGCFSG